jgi:serine kinase of HPr protein (carbohydrate metabolism regulator)
LKADASLIAHASLVARFEGGGWRGALLRGPSGAGKSGLALAAMAGGWRLVADDRTLLWASGGRLFGAAPDRLQGLVEARGLGVLTVPTLRMAEVAVVVDLTSSPGGVERVPDATEAVLAGVKVRAVTLFPQESSAVAKLALALQAAALGARAEEAYQARSHGRGRSAPGVAGTSQEE